MVDFLWLTDSENPDELQDGSYRFVCSLEERDFYLFQEALSRGADKSIGFIGNFRLNRIELKKAVEYLRGEGYLAQPVSSLGQRQDLAERFEELVRLKLGCVIFGM